MFFGGNTNSPEAGRPLTDRAFNKKQKTDHRGDSLQVRICFKHIPGVFFNYFPKWSPYFFVRLTQLVDTSTSTVAKRKPSIAPRPSSRFAEACCWKTSGGSRTVTLPLNWFPYFSNMLNIYVLCIAL